MELFELWMKSPISEQGAGVVFIVINYLPELSLSYHQQPRVFLFQLFSLESRTPHGTQGTPRWGSGTPDLL